MIGKLGKSDFVKSVAVLLTGTLIAQIIAYVVYSLVARAFIPLKTWQNSGSIPASPDSLPP